MPTKAQLLVEIKNVTTEKNALLNKLKKNAVGYNELRSERNELRTGKNELLHAQGQLCDNLKSSEKLVTKLTSNLLGAAELVIAYSKLPWYTRVWYQSKTIVSKLSVK